MTTRVNNRINLDTLWPMITAAAFILPLAACDTVKAPGSAGADPLPRDNYPKVEVEGPLVGWIVVSKPTVTTDGVMKVSTPIRLKSDSGEYANIQYMYTFFDSAGVPLRTQTEWKFLKLEPRTQTFLQGNALDSNAADWRLNIRSGR